jgi:hypothetical protein
VTNLNDELHTAEWIVARLEGDPTLAGMVSGVYHSLIPADVSLPAVRFHPQSPHDVRGAAKASQRIMTRIDWLVVIVHEGLTIGPVVPIADRLDFLLHDSEGTTSTYRVMSCIRLEPFHLIEVEESGVQYRHVGGIYRTLSQPL